MRNNVERFMGEAISMARDALDNNEVPVGCVIVRDNEIIARGMNRRESRNLATAHAEIEAIDSACKKLGSWRLTDCDLYVTMEPCAMCCGAIINSRIRNVYYSIQDENFGCCKSRVKLFEYGFNHCPNVYGGILHDESLKLVKQFFSKIRQQL